MFKTKGRRGERGRGRGREGEKERRKEKDQGLLLAKTKPSSAPLSMAWHITWAYMAPSVHFIHLFSPTDSRAPHVTTPSPASPHRHPPLNYFSHPFSNFFFIPTINEICLKIAQTCTTFFMQVLVIRLLVLGVPIIF